MSRTSLSRAYVIAGISRMVSTAFSPLMAPTYGTLLALWTSILCVQPSGSRVAVLMVILGITCVVPMILIGALLHYGMVSNRELDKRHERHIPYVTAMVCCAVAALYLNHVHSPMWFVMFMVGSTLACGVCLVVNIWWKISAHVTGMGGLVALLFQIHVMGLSAFNLFWLLTFTILLSGILGTARLALKRHTLLQVLAGFVNGYACVTLMMKQFG